MPDVAKTHYRSSSLLKLSVLTSKRVHQQYVRVPFQSRDREMEPRIITVLGERERSKNGARKAQFRHTSIYLEIGANYIKLLLLAPAQHRKRKLYVL